MTRLIEQIVESVKSQINNGQLSPADQEIRKCILREFAKTGKFPSEKEIMKIVKSPSVADVHRTLEKLRDSDLLTLENGRITSSYPFSLHETRHRVTFEDGHSVYALCATDAMGTHFMLDVNITIRSRCPGCEDEIEIVVKDGRIASSNPEYPIEFVSVGKKSGSTAECVCPVLNYFCTKEHLDTWKKKNPEFQNGEVYSLDEVLEDGRNAFRDFLK